MSEPAVTEDPAAAWLPARTDRARRTRAQRNRGRLDALRESGGRRRFGRHLVRRVQANHQAIAGGVPGVCDWLEQVYDYAGNRGSVLILADSDAANLLTGNIAAIVVAG